jgi:hypothetical protein
VVTDSQLLVAANLCGARLTTAINDTVTTTFTVTNSICFVPNMELQIDNEFVKTTAVGFGTMTVIRGFDNSTPSTHQVNAPINNVPAAWYHNALRVEIESIEAWLNAGGGGGGGGTGTSTPGQILFNSTVIPNTVAGYTIIPAAKLAPFIAAGLSASAGILPNPGSTVHSSPYLFGDNGTFIQMLGCTYASGQYTCGGGSSSTQSAALTFTSVLDGTCQDQTFAFSGVTTTTPLTATYPANLTSGLIPTMFASAANTVDVRLCNLSGSSATYTGTFAATNGGSSGGGYAGLGAAITALGTISVNVSGNASTATAAGTTPTLCSAGYAPTGITANFNATGCAPVQFIGTNCSSSASPAVCSAAPSGAVAVPTGTNPTLVIDTTAVTAASEIRLQSDQSATAGAATCNTTLATTALPLVVTARAVGVSFTITVLGTIATNPMCVTYTIVN